MAATVEVETRDGFILVRQTGSLDATEAAQMRGEVTDALERSGIRRVVFDNRATLAPTEAVRNEMHAWVTSPDHFERAAMVLESDLLKIGVNMDALSKRLQMKAFNDIAMAIDWVTR